MSKKQASLNQDLNSKSKREVWIVNQEVATQVVRSYKIYEIHI